jgi:hypothetical protein
MDRDRSQRELDEDSRRDLTRLADGSLEGYGRAELEARVASSPSLRTALERQRAGVTALRGLEIRAPASLRARIAVEAASHEPTPARPRRRRWRLALGGMAGAAAAAALAAALILPIGSRSPTVPDAAQLAERPVTDPVAVADSSRRLLAAEVEGVAFPNWSREFGWRAVGTRTDELGDREARTVVYQRRGKQIAYTIVSGKGITAPSDASARSRNGVNLHAFADGGRHVVTWWRDGRTCVLSASGVRDRELLRLASWRGDGAVSF